MRRTFLQIILPLLISGFIIPQNSIENLPEIPDGFINHIYNLKSNLEKLQNLNLTEILHDPLGQDLIIGQIDPNEIVKISGSYLLDGNLIIVNNGQLILDNADFKINGDITIINNGKLNATGGNFTVIQEYIYEHEAVLWNSSEFHFDGVNFTSSGQSWGISVGDSANYILEYSEITDGFITTGMSGNGTASITSTETPGEFLCLGKNNLQFSNCDFLLMWLVLPDSSIVDVSLPDDSLLIGWHFEEGDSGVSGIPYSLSIDSCTNVLWGLISMSGSDGTFRDTKFRTSGLFFSEPDSITVSNITNNSTHTNDLINVLDRSLRMINTEVQTWNFYPAQNSNITVQNCIFGELLALDSSNVLIENSICDGTGGYLGAVGNSFLVVVRSLISSQVISREFGFLIGALSAFNSAEIDADDGAIMAILNTTTWVQPEAHNSAIIFEEQLPPVEGFIESEVPIEGTARIIAGPFSTIEFEGYSVHFSDDVHNPVWQQTDGLHLNEIVEDTLALWNTVGLGAGSYVLLLTVFHSFGDSIPLISSARLEEIITNVSQDDNNSPSIFKLDQNYPNPFNPTTKIKYSILQSIIASPPRQEKQSQFVTIKVYDVLGNEVAILVNEEKPPGEYEVEFSVGTDLQPVRTSGVYFYQLKAGKFIETKKMILMK
jgi:hypothetical protein